MGVKKIMDTFFASMQEQSMAGYGGRLVNTPMGPFRWNDTMQLWENVNNGMVMNNISFQDSIMMLDYSTIDGGRDGVVAVIPGGDPNLVLYLNFAASAIGPVTYSRGGTASFIDSDRQISFANPNTPRFSYYPTGITVGLLIENTSTNHVLYGSCFGLNFGSLNGWQKRLEGYVEIDSKTEYGLAPDNLTIPWLIMPRGNTQSYAQAIQTYTPAADITGGTCTFSVWVKGYGHSYNENVALFFDNGNNILASYNLPGNTTSTFATGVGFSKIENFGDWKRIQLSGIPTQAGYAVAIIPIPYYNVYFVGEGYTAGNGNTSGILVWGAQFEFTSSASTYIPTNGFTATRGNDLAYISGTGFTWFNGNCGTFVFEFDRSTSSNPNDTSLKTVMGMNYDSSNNYGLALEYTIGSTVASIRAANGNILLKNSGLTNGMNKVSFSYNNNGSQMEVVSSVNGSTTQSQSPDIGDFNISGATFMTLGYKQALVGTTAYDYLDTTIRSVQYWNKALSGASLQQLST